MFFPNKARDTLRTTIPLLLTADKKERGFTPTWTRIRLPIIQKAKESNENRFEQERTEYHDDENTPTLVDSSNSFLEQLPRTASSNSFLYQLQLLSRFESIYENEIIIQWTLIYEKEIIDCQIV